MTYLPLARKYRPQMFADLIGQSHVTTTLSRAIESKRIAQAYLFTGQRGVGKTSAARILAKSLNCAAGPTATPCGRCPSCEQITQGTSLDVLEIDGASNRGIDEIRDLRASVPFAPVTGPFRIYIIDEVHMLTTEAFNALLKTLEEPPAHVKFIFATTAAHKVPATILSRCQRFDFRRIEVATIVEALRRIAHAEQIQLDEPALYAVARASEGSLRDAEVVLEQLATFATGTVTEATVTELLGAMESEALTGLMQAIFERNPSQALKILTAQFDQGKDVSLIITGMLRYLRNLLILSSTKEAPERARLLARLIDEPADRLARLEEQAGRSTPQELLLWLQMATGAYELVRRTPLGQTIAELLVIKLATREQWQSLDQISRRLETLRESAAAHARVEPQHRSASAPLDAEAQTPLPPPATLSPSPLQAAVPPGDPEGHGEASEKLRPDALLTMWPAFLERLGAQKMSLAAYLADAKPLNIKGGVLTIGLPGFALHHEVLSVAENRRLIDRLLSEVYQTPLHVQYATLPEPTAPEAAASPSPGGQPPVSPVIQEIVNLFNATILDRPRPA